MYVQQCYHELGKANWLTNGIKGSTLPSGGRGVKLVTGVGKGIPCMSTVRIARTTCRSNNMQSI